jgi:biopolymer transport protein ExbD
MLSRKRRGNDLAKLEMTPMIDVVFQLLIFFVVTLQQRDILSNLAIARPQTPPVPTPRLNMLNIEIAKDGWVLNGTPITGAQASEQLSRQLARLASFDRNVSVIIKSTSDAPHARLIQALNICAREQMPNISVFSL